MLLKVEISESQFLGPSQSITLRNLPEISISRTSFSGKSININYTDQVTKNILVEFSNFSVSPLIILIENSQSSNVVLTKNLHNGTFLLLNYGR